MIVVSACSEVTARSRPISLVPDGMAWYTPGMSDDRKNPVWPWIAALLIGVPVLYVASFGPACRLASGPYAKDESPAANWAMYIYVPLGKLILHSPDTGYRRLLFWWITTCLPKGHTVMIPTLVEGKDRIAIENL